MSNPIITAEGIVIEQDPLALEIPDDELCKIVDKTIDESKRFWNSKYNLSARRKKMENALFGREITEKEKNNELKTYEARYSNNATYEIEATLKPVAMSHLPDMIVSPGSDNPESEKSAEDISKVINDDIKKRQNRYVLGLGFKHLPVYLTAIIKARWNPELDNYEFINIHPDNVVIDCSATINDANKMRFVPELLTLTIQDLIMRFPDKKDEIFEKLKKTGINGKKLGGTNDFNWRDLATEIKIWEVWFTWYKKVPKAEAPMSPMEEPGNKWEKIEGLLWKYEGIIFKKMRNPDFDFEGQQQLFTYDDPSDENTKRKVNPEEVLLSAMTGMEIPNLQQEQIYFNYFQYPEKPYFFFGYDQWGKVAIDETSRIEQNLFNQDNLNTMGGQIMNTLKARVKNIWSTDAGLSGADVQQLDMDNPKLDALVDGDVNKVHKAIAPERPDAAQFNALNMAKQDMFSLAGATALTGQIQSDVATTNQIAREQNFTRADDIVEDTINAAAEWMARWAMQFIKLRYTEEHFRKLLGAKGSFTFLKIKRDKIEDGMEVMIKASGTDKAKAQKNAMDAAQLGAPFVNPLDFFKDMEYSDPEGRAERGMLFALNPNGYMASIMGAPDTGSQVNMLLGTDAAQQLGQPPAGAGVSPTTPSPQTPSPTNTSQVPTAQPAFPQGSPRGM